jgi:uncharacterized protein YecE (DUF72 family)
MVFVACSGFPVPVSRYWGDFRAVEISDTELGIPGSGTVRRWQRESPRGFAFTLLAPKTFAEEGFRKSGPTRELLEEVARLSTALKAKGVVFVGLPDFKPNKANKTALKSFVSVVPAGIPFVVLDLPAWKPAQIMETVSKKRVTAAYDPLNDAPPAARDLAYVRLPGPAGHRSRYDEIALAQIAEHLKAAEKDHETVFCVFRNIDMHANATAVMKALGQIPA